MDYKTWVLESLISKYEKSAAYTSGTFSKRISINVEKEKKLQDYLEDPDEKYIFLSVLASLKSGGMIDYSWVKYEEGNLLDKIWIIPVENSIRACYRNINRIPTKDLARRLGEQIQEYKKKVKEGTILCRFFDEMLEAVKENLQIPKFFTGNEQMNADILRCLVCMEGNQDEMMERLFSSKVYGDSKYFEKCIKVKVLAILRYWKKKEEEEIPEDEELLREKGIVRWPEILEFTGKMTTIMKNGDVIDFCTQKYGAYINSDTVKQVESVLMEKVRQIIFIENKANYVWYISHQKAEDELVVFHGGCYSPIKGLWFQKIYDGSRHQKEPVRYYHWSDIDVGGFRIFTRLKNEIVCELQPYKMDKMTLMTFRDSAMKIESPSYKGMLEKLGENPAYREFKEVIQSMLEFGIRLEQEKIIV